MDSLGGLLDAPRARGAFSLRCTMSTPWSLRILAESPLTVIAGITGDVWVNPDDGEAVYVGPGDIAITRAPALYNVSESPEAPPNIFIHPGQDCRDAEGESLFDALMHDTRTWGTDPNGSTVFIVGAYEHLSDISDRLLKALPSVISLSRDEWASPLVPMLCEEVVKDEPGQAAVLDRLIDLLVTAVLKAWFAQKASNAPDWWRHQGDRVVEQTLRVMHDDPARSWTLDSLANEVGTSRASLARRFNDIVGEPPMTFLKNWRMALAADLLCQPNESVSTVAHQVGYSTPYAFSAAFKRVRGISPQEHRASATMESVHG
ncbi:MAG: AraC family transcriptional regulator [Pseudomonadota bacterium]